MECGEVEAKHICLMHYTDDLISRYLSWLSDHNPANWSIPRPICTYIYIYIYYVICILYLYIICPLHVHSCFAGFYTNLAYGILPLSSWSVVLKKISASPKFCTAAGFPPFIAVSNCSNSFTDKCPDLMQIDDHMQLRHQWHPLTPSRT